MTKDRLTAFTDAVLAIIMTILVLELEQPHTASLAGLWAIRTSLFSYALSFFWLGAMWVHLHAEWQAVDKVSTRTVWITVWLLFFASLFPYATTFVDQHFMNATAQAFYGVVALLVTASRFALTWSARKDDPANHHLDQLITSDNRWMGLDVVVKIVGMIGCVTIYPPLMMYSVLADMLVVLMIGSIVKAVTGK